MLSAWNRENGWDNPSGCAGPELTFSDWLSLAGILLSLLGFGIAWFQLKKTKNAAESASKSANDAREAIRRLDALLEFNSASKAVDEIITALREDRYGSLPILIGNARKSLIGARAIHTTLDLSQATQIDSALKFLSNFEVKLEQQQANSAPSGKQKIIRGMVEISNNVTAILANSKTKDSSNGE